jgi:PIN domain nuclease of toxin-antitoxin system
MIYLATDTHPLVWYMGRTFKKLPSKVKKAFDAAIEGEVAIWIPSVVLWEISLLQKVGKIKLERSLDECVKHNFGAKAIHVLPLHS